jgi:hypothetical protein
MENNEKTNEFKVPEAKRSEFMVLGSNAASGEGLAWMGVGDSPDPGIQNIAQAGNRAKPARQEPRPLYGKDFFGE